MAIEGLKHLFGVKKSEKKSEKKTQIPEVKYEGPKEGKKISNATLASAMAAALMLPAMTSCINQEQDMNWPDFESYRAEQQQYQQQVLSLLQQLIELSQQNNSQNKKYFEKLLNSNSQILSILNSMSGDLSDIKNTISSIKLIMQDMYQNDQEMLDKINVIINGECTNQEKLDQLIELNKEQNEWLSKIVEMQQTTASINQEISNKIDNYFQQYLEGQMSHTALMEQIIAEIKNNGNITQEISNKIDQIMNGEGADSAKLDEIIKLLESIDSKIGSLVSAVAPYNTGKFSYLNGDINLNNGTASLSSVKMSGPHMALILTGNVNILSMISSLEILGSLSPEVTDALGPVAELSVEKFASFIPKFGAKIASALNTYNAAANKSVLAKIPALTPAKDNTKSFKVILNGNLNNPAGAIDRFQWLNTPEKIQQEQEALQEAVEPQTPVTKEEIKEQIKEDIKQGVTNAIQQNEKVQELKQNKAVKTLSDIYNFYKNSKTNNQTTDTVETAE